MSAAVPLTGPQLEYLEPPPQWEADEVPTLPGSPGALHHSPPIRVAYGLISILVTITGGLGTAFITANQFVIQGDLALTPVEITWLAAVYVMFNVSSNLILFKFRQQFGITKFAEYGIMAFVAIMVLHLLVNDYATALTVRAVSGFVSAPLSSLGFLYMLQVFPKKYAGNGLCLALGLGQAAVPLAWIISPSLTDAGDWKAVYLFELGMAVCSLASIIMLKLPRGARIRVIQPMDFVTFAILMPGIALLCGVLAQGRIEWWLTQPWMAYALIASLGLMLLGGGLEYHRKRPLVQIRWLGSAEILRFVLGSFMLRFLLAEQTYGANTLLRTLGMGPDQFVPLYGVILLGTLVGVIFSGATFGPKMVFPQLLTSIGLMLVGSLLDIDSTSLTRPHDMFVSQFLLACAGGIFLGPLLMLGIQRALARGVDYVVTLVVLFGMTQGIAGLAGSAVYGTFEQVQEQEYSGLINASVDPTNALVAQRLQVQGQVYAKVMTDPVLRVAQGRALLAQSATVEANVRAFNDVFRLNVLLAGLFFVWTLLVMVQLGRKMKADMRAAALAAAAGKAQ